MEQSLNTIITNTLADQAKTKRLQIPFLKNGLPEDSSQISVIMDQLPRQYILNTSWPQYKTLCRAAFSMLYTSDAFLLKFYVTNDYFKSVEREVNGPVHLDNCVEFFVRFNNEPQYYNIEFNCLGIGKVAYGCSNKNRKLLPEALVRNIKTWTMLNRGDEYFDWEMILLISIEVFKFNEIELGEDLICEGNFYKCGDNLPEPHFMSWNKIKADKPNFHKPDFFGKIMLSGYVQGVLEASKNKKHFF